MTMRYHFTPTRVAIIKMDNTVLVRIWRNWSLHILLVGMLNGSAALETSSAVSQNITI